MKLHSLLVMVYIGYYSDSAQSEVISVGPITVMVQPTYVQPTLQLTAMHVTL